MEFIYAYLIGWLILSIVLFIWDKIYTNKKTGLIIYESCKYGLMSWFGLVFLIVGGLVFLIANGINKFDEYMTDKLS